MTDPIDIKNYQHTILNQVKLFGYDTSNNVLNFKGDPIKFNPIKYNPFTSMTFNWQLAQLNKEYIKWITLPFVVSESYWDTWIKVYSPKGKK